MKKIICSLIIIFLLITSTVLITMILISTNEKEVKRWSIAYYEGGPYHEYVDTLRTLILGLMKNELIEKQSIPDYDNSLQYYKWLEENVKNCRLSFSINNFYSAEWNDEKREKIKKDLVSRLKNQEIDLILAMGTWAGKDLAIDDHNIPTISLSVSDPIRSGIIRSEYDSGRDHVTARVDTKRYPRQIKMFHRIVGFDKIGIVRVDNEEGRIFAALDDLYAIAKERGFDVEECLIPPEKDSIETSECLECYRKLVKKVSAIYLTVLSCEEKRIDDIVEIINSHKIPSFSLTTSKYVKKGILMSLSADTGFITQGIYNANKIKKIIGGKSPRSLNQILEDPLFIAINLSTAKRIGFDVPQSIMKIASEVYSDKKTSVEH